MSGDAGSGGDRYWAFISYSHRDAGFGRKLHRRLETYRLPGRIVGKETKQGAVPKRLSPIFRDRDELPAAHNLTTEVRAALTASRSLVVVCSPTAAQSEWVNREIELFRELHPDRPILAALAKGEPEESFPAALRQAAADGAAIEPLAADFRHEGDGDKPALLKLVAGIIGIGLDELVQRDAQRNLRRVMAVTVAAAIIAVAMGLLAILAYTAQREAERQRGEAQGLVGYMITDLREKLIGVGRLDIMIDVNNRALEYYDRQEHLSEDDQAHRAQVLQALGEDDENRGHYDEAMARFQDAYRTTARLYARHPTDLNSIYDHAQSEYWVGANYYYDRGQYDAALPRFKAYKRLADRLVALAPKNPKYHREAGYADGNLCTISLRNRRDVNAAMQYCQDGLAEMQIAAKSIHSSEIDKALVNRIAWLADVYRATGDAERSKAERLVEDEMLSKMIQRDPKNMDLKDTWVALQRALAHAEIDEGKKEEARARLKRALAMVKDMVQFDPTHHDWIQERNNVESDLSKIH